MKKNKNKKPDRCTDNWPANRKKNTHCIVGTQWVEGISSTHKQTVLVAEQNLDEVTTFALRVKNAQETAFKPAVIHLEDSLSYH